MKRRHALACGALALGWLAGVTRAGDPPPPPVSPGPAPYAMPWPESIPATGDSSLPPQGPPLVPPNDAFGVPGGLYGSGAPAHFTAGAGFYMLIPQIQHSPAFGRAEFATNASLLQGLQGLTQNITQSSTGLTTTGWTTTGLTTTGLTTNTAPSFQRSDTYFDFNPDFAPRVWLGYVNDCGLGVRGRWSHFRETANTSTVNDDITGTVVVFSAGPFNNAVDQLQAIGPNDVLTFSYTIETDVWDVEATQDFQIGKWYAQVSGGLRYARLKQNYAAFAVDTATDLTASVTSSNKFTGVGPTIALEVRRPIWGSDLALYGSARGAVLFGNTDRQATKFLDTPAVDQDFAASQNDLLSVFEVELGVEWTKDLGRMRLLGQAAFVGQEWLGAGGATSQDGNLGFLGLTVTAGVNY